MQQTDEKLIYRIKKRLQLNKYPNSTVISHENLIKYIGLLQEDYYDIKARCNNTKYRDAHELDKSIEGKRHQLQIYEEINASQVIKIYEFKLKRKEQQNCILKAKQIIQQFENKMKNLKAVKDKRSNESSIGNDKDEISKIQRLIASKQDTGDIALLSLMKQWMLIQQDFETKS